MTDDDVVDVDVCMCVCGGGGGGGVGGGNWFPFIKFQNPNTSISILFSSRYDKVYIWEADCGKMREE